MTSLSPELIPNVEVVEEDPQTPTMKNINVANSYDWQHRANAAEQELCIERIKLEREKRKTRRFQSQISEYTEALARSVQDCSHLVNQCQLISNANLALSGELRKAKFMVETLEAVILLLYTSSRKIGEPAQQGPTEG